MDQSQIVAGVAGAILLAVAGALAVPQIRQLRRAAVDVDDAAFLRRQAVTRLVGCGLLAVLAGMIAGAYLSGLEAKVLAIAEQRTNGQLPPDGPERDTMRFYTVYWGAALLLILALVILAVTDALSVLRHGRGKLRALRADRSAMIAEQLEAIREEKRQLRDRHKWN